MRFRFELERYLAKMRPIRAAQRAENERRSAAIIENLAHIAAHHAIRNSELPVEDRTDGLSHPQYHHADRLELDAYALSVAAGTLRDQGRARKASIEACYREIDRVAAEVVAGRAEREARLAERDRVKAEREAARLEAYKARLAAEKINSVEVVD